MNVIKQKISTSDFENACINNQKTYNGTSLTEDDPTKVFFITSIHASAAVTIKDADGNTVVVCPTNQGLTHPIRFDKKFVVTGAAFSLVYCFVQVQPQQ